MVVRVTTYKQTLLDARWSGVKDGILFMMRRYEEDGKAHCWECGVPGDAGSLEAHRTRSRAQGGSYEARNCEILCSTCREKATGTVQLSEGAAT